MGKRRWLGLALFLLMAMLFLISNRGAYQSYFQDDELDNLSWAPSLPLSTFARGLATARFTSDNFRPVGHFYFWLAGRMFGLDFPKYVFPLHAIHLLNVWLLWLLIRKLGGSDFGACAGALLFAFHMAVFDIYWKPMYVFDLLCATFCLLALLAWVHGRWVWAFAAFWLAYKAKELAVMLPFVLACYEYWLGKRRWKPLLPFFAVSLTFGLQGLLLNPYRGGDYAFRYRPWDLLVAARFYADRILLLPMGGLVAVLVPAFVRDRRVWLGIAALLLFFVPLAPLGGRLYGAYCYVPLIGCAVALSGVADRGHRVFVAIFLIFWVPFNFIHLRLNRRQALVVAEGNRRYVTAVRDFAFAHPGTRQFLYDGRPFALRPWGIQGALACAYGTHPVTVYGMEDKGAQAVLQGREAAAVLNWDPRSSRLAIVSRDPGAHDAAFIDMNLLTPIWQLERGWFALEDGFRWTRPAATARLYRPPAARRFELTVNMSPDMIRERGGAEVRVFLDQVMLGSRRITSPGWQKAGWNFAPGGPATAEVRLEADPYHPSNGDPRTLGIAVVSFGFVE
jgi:hypothetical protein